jgi:1-acyl-sn-glycerol-3-phosphate acyltransferase/acyl carrier protein
MINNLLAFILKILTWLRYRVRIRGLESIKQKCTSGILFLPNHPALIEPIILASHLYKHFKVRALADENQVNRFMIRYLAHRTNVLTLPDLGRDGMQSAEQVREVISKCIEALKHGDNLILYPAGRIYRQNTEQIGANSAVERIVRALPDVRIVLVRTKGFWGSGFSWAPGYRPLVTPVLLKGLKAILLNGIFFTPRRAVDIELIEPEDFPRKTNRMTINTYLEKFYNHSIEKNTYVPYTIWEHGGNQIRPEPEKESLIGDVSTVSLSVRRQVYRHLQDITGAGSLNDSMSLVHDLGMDSLAAVDLITWLESEYGYSDIELDALRTVEDVLLAASGTVVSIGEKKSYRIPKIWFNNLPEPQRPENIKEMTIPDVFLYQAKRQPNKVAIADQMSGVLTYRRMVIAIMLLKKKFAVLEGEYIGIMFPSSAAACLVYLAVLLTGKVPVMINWTLGQRNLELALKSLNIKHIVTAKTLLSRIEAQGFELNEFKDYFVLIENIRKQINGWDKLCAFAKGYTSWSELSQVKSPETAAVLFTSGSESLPKAVPLTHRNILTNVSDSYECFTLSGKDGFLGILPPFHSFGLTVSMILPLCLGSRVFFYPNPTHGGALAQIISAYKLTILPGAPTF